MASSRTSASWSPDGLLDEPTRDQAPRTSEDDDVSAQPEQVTSRLRTRKTLRDICKKYSIPDDFAPLLAGDLPSCSPPPPGSVCVYVDALDAGLRLPLHPFFGTVLSHFGLAPGQLAPNGWRALAGFVVLSHFAGVAPSLAVFRYFFALCKFGNFCSFRSKDASGLLFGKLNVNIRGWKEEFFFLLSSAPWPCPVQWGVPSRSATFEPTLTGQEKGMAAELLRARGGCPIDLTTYLHERNLATAKIIRPAPSLSQTPQDAVVMEAPVHVTMEDVRAEKAAALLASARKVAVKTEKDCIAQPCATSSSGKRRKLAAEATSSASDTSCPPGFSTSWKEAPPVKSENGVKQWSALPQYREGDTGDWKAARQRLQSNVTPERARELAASRPADVVASSFLSLLQTTTDVVFSLGHALELEDKLRARDREAVRLAEEADALRAELRKAKAELAETKAAAAARGLSGSSRELSRTLAERELRGYERGMEDMKRAALRRYPNLDPARLVVPLHGLR